MITQEMTDKMVERIIRQTSIYGGKSPKLEKLRQYYKMFHDHPDSMSYVLVTVELDFLEDRFS